MTIHFLPVGTAVQWVSYVTGMIDSKGRDRPYRPIEVAGSPESLLAATRNSPLANPMLSAVLSYREPFRKAQLPRMKTHEAEFAQLISGGIPAARLPRLSVAHFRSMGADTHIGMSKLDLATGREVPLWSNTIEEKRLLNAWRRKVNLEDDLSDPDDRWDKPFRVEPPDDLSPAEQREFRDANYLHIAQASTGFIRDREGIVVDLVFRGYSEPAVDDDAVEVMATNGTRFRFRGPMYTEGFDFSQVPKARHDERGPRRRRREIERLKRRLRRLKGKRYQEFARRFGTKSLDVQRPALLRLLAAHEPAGVAARGRAPAVAIRPHPKPVTPTAAAIPSSTETQNDNHHGKQPNQPKHGVILRILRERRLFAESLHRAVDRQPGRTREAHFGAREITDERDRLFGLLWEGVGSLQRSVERAGEQIERHGHAGGGRAAGKGFSRDLEHARGNCERARCVVAAHLSVLQEAERIRNARRTMRPLRKPNVQPDQHLDYGH